MTAISLDELKNQARTKSLHKHTNSEITKPLTIFATPENFEIGQRMAKLLTSSELVPMQFRQNVANTVIALEMANRMGASPLAIMQNIHVIHGKPTWSSQFIIATINSCGRFGALRFTLEGADDDYSCFAWAIEKESNERLAGPAVSIGMAKAEGWYAKNGSKWKTMPDLMLRYRAATFFGRLYAPEILMGMKTNDEIHDTYETESVGGNYVVKTTEELQPDNANIRSPEQNKPKKQSQEEFNESIPVGDDNDQGLFEGVE